MSEKDYYKKLRSPIPPHLTPEEKEKWTKEMEWEKQELERRRKEGRYGPQGNFFQRVIRSIKGR